MYCNDKSWAIAFGVKTIQGPDIASVHCIYHRAKLITENIGTLGTERELPQ
jgi:hypothetical protein